MSTTATPIADQVALVQRNTAGRAPAAVAPAMPSGIAAVGTAMPDGALLDVYGQPTILDKVRNGKPAVIVFYRGAWCPYCNLTLRTYQQTLALELDARGVALIAISPQKPDGSLSMQEKHALTYAVLSDPGNQIAGPLGILTAPSEDARQTQVAHGLDLTAINADGTTAIPMPTVVIVDGAGTIRWIDVHPNYTTRTEPGQILDALATTIGQ